MLGGGWVGDPISDGHSYTLREASQQGNWRTACELFPQVRKLRCVDAWGDLQAQSLDDLPFIGSVSGLEGLTLVLGSWYGFALAPAIGSFVADHVAGLPTPELDQLSPHRVAHFDPAQVAAFLAESATSNVLEEGITHLCGRDYCVVKRKRYGGTKVSNGSRSAGTRL